MASSDATDPFVFQKFKTEDESSLRKLRCHLCAETEEGYLLWTDIQHAFNDIDYLRAKSKERVLFTTDADGELHHPLRIPHDEDAYVVVHRTFQKDQTEEFHDGEGDSQNQPFQEFVPSLKRLFDTCLLLNNHLESIIDGGRDIFQQATANTRYYHSMLVEEIERLDRTGFKILVDEKGREQLLEELHVLQKKVLEWDYRNICYNTLQDKNSQWEYATSALFIVLPSGLDAWDDPDPPTQLFLLQFMCDNCNWENPRMDLPQHVHLCNHPGYSLKRPEEFFQKYGDYILRVLQMVKRGYTDNYYDIPPLDTLKILWNCDPNIIGSRLAMDIKPLVDRAISYFQELSPPKWKEKLGLTCGQSAAIKTFLDVEDGDSTESNLYRYINQGWCIFWKCEAHAHQHLSTQSLEHLREFIHRHVGHVDMQQARIRVELGSIDEVDQFRTHLSVVKHTFDISIKLNWKATRSEVKKFCLDIGGAGIGVLELDGITLDIHPQGYGQYRNNLFYHDIISNTDLRVITLLNYPRPQERCVHVYRYSLQLENLPVQSSHDWMALWSDLAKFNDVVSAAQDPSDWNRGATSLQSTLEKHGMPGTYMVTMYNDEWNAVFDPNRSAVVEVHSVDMVYPKGVLSAGSIRTLGVHLKFRHFDQKLFNIMRTNTRLRDLYVSYNGHNILYYTEHIVRMWHESSCPFRLTLLDRMEDSRGRVVAQLAFGGSDKDYPINSTVDNHGRNTSAPVNLQQHLDVPDDIVFTQWDCDHVFSQLSDYSAAFLSTATQEHLSVLTLFTLDVSRLSRAGLTSIQEVLRRSNLEYLNIVCTPFQPNQANEIARVLGSVQWLSLNSLVVSGNHINAWIDLCPSPFSPSLLSVQIQGTLSNIQELSHTSTMCIHQLICTSSLVELCIQNVQLQEKRDWELIVESMDVSLLQTLSLGEHDFMQLLSVPDAITVFGSRLEAAALDTDGPKLFLPSFTLDFATLSQSSLKSVQKIFSHCCFEKLIVKCDGPIDLNVSDPIASVLDSVPWLMLKHLCLSGDSISQWIQLLTKVDAPKLKSLNLRGAQLVRQELTHSSVLFVERLIGSSPLMVHLEDVQLQDPHDWVRLVEKMHPSMLENFQLGENSFEQFMSTPDAAVLKQLKQSQWDYERLERSLKELQQGKNA